MERHQIVNLYRQILSIRERLPSSSWRTRILRRAYLRVEFLLGAVQCKVLYFDRTYERSVHFIDVDRSSLGFCDNL